MKNIISKIYKNSQESYFKKIHQYSKENTKKMIVTANPEIIMQSNGNKEIKEMLLDKNVDIVADGISVVKAALYLNYKIEERITGIDICNEILRYANKNKKSIAFFGSKEEVIIKLKKVLNDKYPNIIISSIENGYIKDKDKYFQKISEQNPDFVLVALGVPKQEQLIYKHIKKFKKGIFIGVGGSFDVISESKKRAPKFFIKTNTEWLYRIMLEPKRIKRFYKNNIKFMVEIKKQKK